MDKRDDSDSFPAFSELFGLNCVNARLIPPMKEKVLFHIEHRIFSSQDIRSVEPSGFTFIWCPVLWLWMM